MEAICWLLRFTFVFFDWVLSLYTFLLVFLFVSAVIAVTKKDSETASLLEPHVLRMATAEHMDTQMTPVST